VTCLNDNSSVVVSMWFSDGEKVRREIAVISYDPSFCHILTLVVILLTHRPLVALTESISDEVLYRNVYV